MLSIDDFKAACQICGRIVDNMCTISAQSIQHLTALRVCVLREVLYGPKPYFVCTDCMYLTDLHANNIESMRRIRFYNFFHSRLMIHCVICFNSRNLRQMKIAENSIKNIPILRLNGGIILDNHNTISLCGHCNALINNLTQLYQSAFNTELEKAEPSNLLDTYLPSEISGNPSDLQNCPTHTNAFEPWLETDLDVASPEDALSLPSTSSVEDEPLPYFSAKLRKSHGAIKRKVGLKAKLPSKTSLSSLKDAISNKPQGMPTVQETQIRAARNLNIDEVGPTGTQSDPYMLGLPSTVDYEQQRMPQSPVSSSLASAPGPVSGEITKNVKKPSEICNLFLVSDLPEQAASSSRADYTKHVKNPIRAARYLKANQLWETKPWAIQFDTSSDDASCTCDVCQTEQQNDLKGKKQFSGAYDGWDIDETGLAWRKHNSKKLKELIPGMDNELEQHKSCQQTEAPKLLGQLTKDDQKVANKK